MTTRPDRQAIQAQARLTALRGLMPGATDMTREITAVILTQRGLLKGP
jgi:hypothetical protein